MTKKANKAHVPVENPGDIPKTVAPIETTPVALVLPVQPAPADLPKKIFTVGGSERVDN